MSDTKRWVRVSRTAKGDVTVKVTLQRDNLSANWSVKSFTPSEAIAQDLQEATKHAERVLEVLEKVMSS